MRPLIYSFLAGVLATLVFVLVALFGDSSAVEAVGMAVGIACLADLALTAVVKSIGHWR